MCGKKKRQMHPDARAPDIRDIVPMIHIEKINPDSIKKVEIPPKILSLDGKNIMDSFSVGIEDEEFN